MQPVVVNDFPTVAVRATLLSFFANSPAPGGKIPGEPMTRDVSTLSAQELLEHAEWLRRLARALVRDPDDAGDLAQEAWETALAQPPREPGPLRPWLAGVARNLAKMRYRSAARRRRRELASDDLGDRSVPTPEMLTQRVQTQQLVARHVLELAEPQRSTLLLRYYEGLSAAEIARRLDIPAGTVRWRLKRGLDQLRDRLDDAHDGDRKRWGALLAPLSAAPATAGATLTTGVLLMKLASTIGVAVLAIALAVWLGGRAAGWWGSDAADPVANAPAPPTSPDAPAPSPAARGGLRLAADDGAATTRDDDPVGTLRLEGQVIDADEHPVGGATVAIDANPPRTVVTEQDGSFAFTKLIGRDYRVEAHAGDAYAGPVQLRLTATTEPVILHALPAGRLQVEVRDAATGDAISGADVELRSALVWSGTSGDDGMVELRGVGAGNFPLLVRARGYAPAAVMLWTSGDPDEARRQRVELRRGAAVSGRVVDERGKPVAGARVVATATSEPFPVVDPRRDGVVTGKNGAWKLDAVAAGTYRISATHPRYAPAALPPTFIDGERPRDDLTLQLSAGASLAGEVRTAEGAPVPGADVRVVGPGSVDWRMTRQAYTDAAGAFRIDGLPRTAVETVARHADGASQIEPVDLTARADAHVTLTLAEGGVLAGVVVGGDGETIAEAQVLAEPDWTGELGERQAWQVRGIQMRVSDSAGAFRFTGLPEGAYRVRAARPGSSEAALWLAPGELARTGNRDLRLVVPADGRLVGRVLFDDGTPPELFSISIGPTSPVPFATADGAFELDAPGGAHNVVVSGPSFVRTMVEARVDGAGDTDLGTITVKRGRSVSGRVIDADGAPVPGAQVAAGALLSGSGAELYIAEESIDSHATETDADGRFSFGGMGEHRITVVAGLDGARSSSITIPPGSASVEVDLVLASTGSLEGRITRDGAPVPDTVVIATPAGATSSNFFVVTGPDGSYALDALTAGEYLVYPMIGGGGPKPKDMFFRPVTIAAGQRARADIEIRSGTVTVEIAVSTDAGDPVAAAQVFLIGVEVDVPTAGALRDGAWIHQREITDPIPVYLRMAMGGPTSIAGVTPGPHTACVIPFPIDPGNPLAAQRIRAQMEQLPMKCTPFRVAASPAEQRVEVRVPASWTVPAD